jgi:NADPH-dependent curcumin reductase CurA
MIPTYEDVLKINKADILEAGFAQKNNEPCIFVRAHTGELGYTDIYYISAYTGLLSAAETYDGETLVYSMTAGNVSLNTPPDDKFVLPDGKSAIS